MEEPRSPEVLLYHYEVNGVKFHAKYIRYFREDDSVRDYLVHKSIKECDCT